ncbi:hypothetical protein LguiA_018954 [Lonicera macranthoides]
MEKRLKSIVFCLILLHLAYKSKFSVAARVRYPIVSNHNDSVVWPTVLVPEFCLAAGHYNVSVCADRSNIKGCKLQDCAYNCLQRHSLILGAECESINTCLCCFQCE